MSEPTNTTAIKNLIAGISGINNVYDYERWTKDERVFRNLFKDTDKIYAWEVGIPKMEYDKKSVGMGKARFNVVYNYRVTGYLSLSDSNATEKDMRVAAQLVMLTLLKGQTDSNNLIVSTQQGPLQDIDIVLDHYMLFNVLCHRAQLTFKLIEEVCTDNITEYDDMHRIAGMYNWPEYQYGSPHGSPDADREYDSNYDGSPDHTDAGADDIVELDV